jgi:hypothetical protein
VNTLRSLFISAGDLSSIRATISFSYIWSSILNLVRLHKPVYTSLTTAEFVKGDDNTKC